MTRTSALAALLFLMPCSAAADAPPIDELVAYPLEFHHVEIGFAQDSILDVIDYTVAPMLWADVSQRTLDVFQVLRDHDMVGANGLPNLTINHVIPSGLADINTPVVDFADVTTALRPVLDEANVIVGMAAIPAWRVPAPFCGSGTRAPGVYTQGLWDDYMAGVGGRNQHPPMLGGALCPYTFGPSEYEDWVEDLTIRLHRAGARGLLDWETGNEPDSPDQFWGNPAQYRGKAERMAAGIADGETYANARRGRVWYGAYGSGTTFNTATHWTFDGFRNTVPAFVGGEPDHRGFSYHVFRNPCHASQEKPWQLLRDAPWPADNVEHRSMTAFDTWGKVSFRWQEDVENSSFLVLELAELFLHAQERDLESIYFWTLMDEFGDNQSGSFDEFGVPKPGFEHLAAVWDVVKDGYRAWKWNGVVTLEGANGLILKATDRGPLPPLGSRIELACKQEDLTELPWLPMAECVCDRFARMDWVIYTPTDGQLQVACDRGLPTDCHTDPRVERE